MNWMGDMDSEHIFGAFWNDTLNGMAGDDILYGFEGNDTIYGGDGADRLFGDSGDDIIYTQNISGTGVAIDGDFASGGSGNDKLYGDNANDNDEYFFGGPGHDTINAYGGADEIDGGDGDDTI